MNVEREGEKTYIGKEGKDRLNGRAPREEK